MYLRTSFLLVFLFFTIVSEAGKKKKQKIIIHVPYKIHKHLHTHTNYKVINVPEKKEKTVIFYKQEEPKKPEFSFVSLPPHQESAQEMKHQIPTNFLLNSHPIAEASFINGVIASTKIPFIKDAPQTKNQFKNLLLRTMMRGGHLIKEPTQFKNIKPQLPTHQTMNTNLKAANLKAQGSINKFVLAKNNNFNFQRLKESENTSEESQEYEHVGYLVLDGKSRKIMDKSLQNVVSSW